MNKVFTSIILALGLVGTAMAQMPNSSSLQQDPNEIIVLSSYVDGNYNVERLLVMESSPSNNEFVVHYKINLTQLISSYNNNSQEIAGLKQFIESIQSDSLKRITHFDIVGLASPDGPAALNKRLATTRADDFCKYIDTEFGMSDYSRSVSSTPYTWIDTKGAIERSAVPNKSEVLAIIESGKTQSQIQAELAAHESSWNYIKANILPPMRCVELHVKYNSWKVVENRTLIEEVVPSGVVATGTNGTNGRGGRGSGKGECCQEGEYDDYINCVLVEMPGNQIDFEDDCCTDKAKFKANRRGVKYMEHDDEEREKIKARVKRWAR